MLNAGVFSWRQTLFEQVATVLDMRLYAETRAKQHIRCICFYYQTTRYTISTPGLATYMRTNCRTYIIWNSNIKMKGILQASLQEWLELWESWRALITSIFQMFKAAERFMNFWEVLESMLNDTVCVHHYLYMHERQHYV